MMERTLSTEPEILRVLGDASKAGRGSKDYKQAIQEIAKCLSPKGLEIVRVIYGNPVDDWRTALDVLDAYKKK